MADTNPPQGSPGAPSGQPTGVPPNAVPKIELTQIMDVSKFQRDLSDTILNSFGEAGSKVEGLLLPKSYKAKKMADLADLNKKQMDDGKKLADAEMLFLRQVSTKRRYQFEELRRQKAEEFNQLKKAGSSETQLKAFQLSAEKQINEAKKAAEKSESKVGTALGLNIGAAQDYLATLVPILSIWEVIAKVIMQAFHNATEAAKTANALRSGGLSGANLAPSGMIDKTAGMFKGIGNFDAETQMKWLQQLAKTPAVLDNATFSNSKMVKMVGTLGTEFQSVDQIMATLGMAAEDTGMTMDQLRETFLKTKGASVALKIDHLKNLNTTIQMRAAMRGVTTDANAATDMMNSLVVPLQKIGVTGATKQIEQLQMGFAKFAGSLSVSKMTGMFAFAHGGQLATDQDIDKIMDSTTGLSDLMSDYFKKIGGLNPDASRSYIFAQKAAEASGFQLGDAQQQRLFAKYLIGVQGGTEKAKTNDELAKLFGAKNEMALVIQGLDNLAKQRSIEDQVKTIWTQFLTEFGTPLIDHLQQLQLVLNTIGQKIPNFMHVPTNQEITEQNIRRDHYKKKFPMLKDE